MYILDYHRQLELIREMTQLRKDDENWVVYYHHPTTNEMWKSYFPKASNGHRGPKILRQEPVPENLAERFDECLTGDNTDNAIGLGIELSVNPAKWDAILTVLEKCYHRYEREQLSLFLKYLGIFDPEKLFDEINRKPAEFDLDKRKLKELKRRARMIKIKRLIRFW